MHSIIKCSCGVVVAQCRCPALDKPVEVREKACGGCIAKEVLDSHQQNRIWEEGGVGSGQKIYAGNSEQGETP